MKIRSKNKKEKQKENVKMKKVGKYWDYENDVCGEYRYNEI